MLFEVYTDEPRRRDLQFCTVRGGLKVRQLAAILSVSDLLIANRLTDIFRLTGHIPSRQQSTKA